MNKAYLFLLLMISQLPHKLALAETLKWGYLNFPPFNYADKDHVAQGSVADMIKDVTSKANISVSSFQYPNRRAYMLMENGNINFTVIPKNLIINKEKHLISQFPVSKIKLNAYWIGNKPPIKKFEELQGMTVILIAGYRYGSGREYFENKNNKVTITSNVENHSRAFDSLVKGRADYMLGYKGPAEIALRFRTIGKLQHSLVSEFDAFFVLTKETKDAENIMKRLEQSYIDIYGLPE